MMKPPETSKLGDHDVALKGDYLAGKHIAVLVTGSVAAMKAPLLVRALRRYGAETTVFASKAALRYVALDALRWASNREVVVELSYQSEHLNGGKPYDAYLVAPASYNTINKFASGVADSTVTVALSSALGHLRRSFEDGPRTDILLAPAMHGSMHNPILEESLSRLKDYGVTLIPSRQAYGKNNLPSVDVLVAETCHTMHFDRTYVRRDNYSYGPRTGYQISGTKDILITAGAVGTKVDNIRRLTNRFSGKLGVLIAQELYLRGHLPALLQANSGMRAPSWLPDYAVHYYDDYDDYLARCLTYAPNHEYGIYTAAVADYRPVSIAEGKMPSGEESLNLELAPTKKVIDLVHKANPHHKIISFKYEHDASVSQLATIAQKRIKGYHTGVVTNSGAISERHGKQAAYLFSGGRDEIYWPRPKVGIYPPVWLGKPTIAKRIVDELENPQGAFAKCLD